MCCNPNHKQKMPGPPIQVDITVRKEEIVQVDVPENLTKKKGKLFEKFNTDKAL